MSGHEPIRLFESIRSSSSSIFSSRSDPRSVPQKITPFQFQFQFRSKPEKQRYFPLANQKKRGFLFHSFGGAFFVWNRQLFSCFLGGIVGRIGSRIVDPFGPPLSSSSKIWNAVPLKIQNLERRSGSALKNRRSVMPCQFVVYCSFDTSAFGETGP